ncbi:MAG: MoxR family ATPase [Acidilobaceae archaeon]
MSLLQTVIREASEILIEREYETKCMLASLLARGHVLLEGVPGVAKTLTAKVVAGLLGLDFRRVQMTPDLLPSDIIGGHVYDQKTGEFKLRLGPIFTNVLLVDEINRASPRTQSALLEAMQERQVTIEGVTVPLPEPFIVIATQNPIEFEGVFPLPEAQLDRFMARVQVGYPTSRGFIDMLRRIEEIEERARRIKPVMDKEAILEEISRASSVRVDDSILEYIARLVEESRKHPAVKLGGSPRAGIAILRLAKAWAHIEGRSYVIPDDVKAVAYPALSHRLILKPEYELEGVQPEAVVKELLAKVPVPRP